MPPPRLERKGNFGSLQERKIIGHTGYGYRIKICQRDSVSFYPSGSNMTDTEILWGTSRPIESIDFLFLSVIE